MSMISEQVNRLRGYAEVCRTVSDHITAKYLDGAADTIEELSAKLHNSQMERSSMYYNGGWIPVSDRTPEKDDQYICTVKFKHDDGYPDVETHAVEYTKAYGGWDMGRFFSDCNPRIIAWMPLPEPSYNAEGSEE